MKKYFNLYKKQFILGPAFKLAEAILELFVPITVASMIDKGIAVGDTAYIFKMGIVLFLLALFGVLFAIVCQYSAAVAQQGVGTHLRNDIFDKINLMSREDIDTFTSASLTTRITNDITQIQSAVAMLIRLVFRSPFLIVGSLIAAVGLDAKMSIIFFVAALLVSVILYYILSRSLPLYSQIQRKLDRAASIVKDSLSGVRVIRAFSRTEYEKDKFEKANEELTERSVKVGRLSALLNPLTFAVMNTAIVLILYFGGIKVNTGKLTQAVVLDFEPSMTDANARFTQADETRPAVEFKSVCYSYGEADENVLTDVDFSINKGETVGIIGGTGSGKTTLVSLIMRFYDVDSGEIDVFGHDVRDYKFSALRSIAHIVPQENRLFSGSVRKNLLYGDQNATEEDIERALRISQSEEFVKKLPNGLDTEINENSKNLSGGQRQRLCIARALLGNPKIVIFDDSSSALDFATDSKLRKAIHDELSDTTVIIVSQRVNTVKSCDRIIVMNEGGISAIGTHSELYKTNEVYNEICLSQLSEREVDAQ